jgi:hypothetical protein
VEATYLVVLIGALIAMAAVAGYVLVQLTRAR